MDELETQLEEVMQVLFGSDETKEKLQEIFGTEVALFFAFIIRDNDLIAVDVHVRRADLLPEDKARFN